MRRCETKRLPVNRSGVFIYFLRLKFGLFGLEFRVSSPKQEQRSLRESPTGRQPF
jgi:hypothetical protein